jgi:hypothetical protein
MNKMFKIVFLLCVFVFVGCSSGKKETVTKDWRQRSNELAREYAFSWGELYPEYISRLGFEEFDSKAINFSKNLDNLKYSKAYKWKKRLSNLLEVEKHPEYKTDLKILLENVELDMEEIELNRELGVVSFFPMSEFVLANLKKIKSADGLKRFHRYVRGEGARLPLFDGHLSYLLNQLDYLEENHKRGFWPHVSEVKDYLKNSDEYFKALEKVLEKWPKERWERDLSILKSQDNDYRKFLTKKIIPFCRKSSVIHPRYYAFMLKGSGIHASPEELIKNGLADYKLTYKKFTELAQRIARKENLSKNDPVSVVSYLKDKKITNNKDLLKAYEVETKKIATIMEEQKLVSMIRPPNYILRMASPDEMRSMPSPHFSPTPILAKEQTPSEFVIPQIGGKDGIDDFTFKEAIINLIAHEAIPGHALQYQVIKERGTTLIRAFFAMNSANVEGWAHYAEEIITPFVDLETQFITLQRRLWRQARMFLDSQLNLGLISQKRIFQVFVQELGFSSNWAQIEFDRYSHVMPGQAPAYYYGHQILTQTKKKVQDNNPSNFTEKCFNDAVLDLGVIPLREVTARLGKDLNCDDE